MQDALTHLLAGKAVVVWGWLILLLALERLRPAAPPPPDLGWRRLGRNFGLFAVNAVASRLIVLPVSAAAATVGIGWRPEFWQGWPGLVLDLLVLDLWIYWWHRANHALPFLWRFHEVHHLDRFLDASTAVRFHVGEVILSALVRAAVILLFAIPLTSILVFETLVLVAAIFQHSNLRLPPRLEAALARLIVTPSIHWVHHHRVRRDTDSNYATLLSLWDPLFGSRSPTARWPEMPIGVEARDERPLPGLLLRPVRG